MKLAWMTRWTARTPATATDEWWRHTLVLPIPFTARTDEDGDVDHLAIVLVTRPWWLCRYALRRDYRDYVRWDRASTAALYAVFDDEQAWDLVHGGFARTRPPFPASI